MDSKTECPPRGKFIVIEGGEGAGKTTVLQKLQAVLPSENYVFSREPGGTQVAQGIRQLLLHSTVEMEVLTEFILFWASRAEHIGKIIRPALLAGKHVICDRFDSSTFAYQVEAREQQFLLSAFDGMQRLCCGEIRPDIYVYLDVDPQEGVRRALSRKGEEINHFDQKDLDFHLRVFRGYRRFFETHPHEVVDANRSPEEVLTDVLSVVTRVCAP